MKFDTSGFSKEELLDIYDKLLLPRLIEEKMLILLRQGKISKWFSGYGQEAVSVGSAFVMNPDEYMLPMHRNLGIFTTRGVPLNRLFSQFQGKMNGFTKGRDRSFHFGSKEHNIVGMISHLGPQMGIADGIALATKLQKENKATLVVTGDGGASEGDFHESVNTAAVWDLPVIFMIENNQWGLSTPSSEQFRCDQFIDKGIGYGMETEQIDGNNILDVIRGLRNVTARVRETGKPVLTEMITFRMRGHEEASGTKYYPEGLQDEWAKHDPIVNYESFLVESGVLTEEDKEKKRKELKELINAEWNTALEEPEVSSSIEDELNDVYASFDFEEVKPAGEKNEMRFVDAVSDGLREAMKKHDGLVLMGQDIAEYGGVFKITDGFVEEFGKERVRNTPLCESAILGAGLGLSIKGQKAMVEMQFADFVSEGITQICNNLAKIHYRWGQNADVVVRMPTGAGVGAGPYHSQSNEMWFAHIPGLKIAYPAFPEDAKGLLLTAFEDPGPVMFFEHKALYRSKTGNVPEGYYNQPFGKASLVREGEDITIVTYGMGVHWAMDYLDQNPNINADLIDLRTLVPLDTETVYQSVQKTSKVIILHEDTLFGGFGAELAAQITEHCFEYLDGPVKRVASIDSPVPFAGNLEKEFLPNERFAKAVKELLDY
ncbi:MAG: dehydrogenase E1 component subunit alpha/beta [Salibacter sp.]|uniref:alpha-ketoacid dehydrogenase subunit alpha/beta n=2 Tax=Salibacter sp. TaxID=2010995 RepID=UPI00287058F2|nr:dehydrogenase E1 component subunit alpha/beta [Salibacter sp.]MDR9398520.1 dehydrogenase E1 component subunit alpha/beta [Salibacter sp.]